MVTVRPGLNKRIPASSLLEVTVAMVIIVIVVVLALQIFTKVTQSTLPLKKIRANALISHYQKQFEAEQGGAQTFYQGDWRIVESVKPYDGDASLSQLEIVVFDANNEQIAYSKKVLKGHDQ